MALDSRFHQTAKAWASMIVPNIIFSVFGQDASASARKRRLDYEEEKEAKRLRGVAATSIMFGRARCDRSSAA